ncbi:MAG: hypothetical protein ABI835_15950 [Chloroflexota bacterium]
MDTNEFDNPAPPDIESKHQPYPFPEGDLPMQPPPAPDENDPLNPTVRYLTISELIYVKGRAKGSGDISEARDKADERTLME